MNKCENVHSWCKHRPSLCQLCQQGLLMEPSEYKKKLEEVKGNGGIIRVWKPWGDRWRWRLHTNSFVMICPKEMWFDDSASAIEHAQSFAKMCEISYSVGEPDDWDITKADAPIKLVRKGRKCGECTDPADWWKNPN